MYCKFTKIERLSIMTQKYVNLKSINTSNKINPPILTMFCFCYFAYLTAPDVLLQHMKTQKLITLMVSQCVIITKYLFCV